MNFIKDSLKYIGKGYKRNVITLISGRILGQALPILLTPILARLYSPGEYGIFAVYNTIVTIVSMAVNGRYCLAVLLPKKDIKAKGIIKLSAILTIFFSVLTMLIMLIWGGDIFGALNAEMLNRYSLVLVLNIIAVSLHEILFYYALRNKKYKLLSLDIFIYGLVLVGIRIGMGYLGYSSTGLFISYAVAYSESFLFLYFGLGLHKQLSKVKTNLRKLAKRYSKFPKFTLWADGLHLFALMLPNTLFNKYFGSQSAGHYAMSDRILGSPIWLVTMSVRDVFNQEAAARYREGKNITPLFWKTAKASFFLGIIPFVLVYIFSPVVLPVILGPGWDPVIGYVKVFSLMYFARFVVNPVSHIPNVVGKQWVNLLFQGLLLLSLLLSFIWAGSLNASLIVWSVLTTLSYSVMFIISWILTISASNNIELENENF